MVLYPAPFILPEWAWALGIYFVHPYRAFCCYSVHCVSSRRKNCSFFLLFDFEVWAPINQNHSFWKCVGEFEHTKNTNLPSSRTLFLRHSMFSRNWTVTLALQTFLNTRDLDGSAQWTEIDDWYRSRMFFLLNSEQTKVFSRLVKTLQSPTIATSVQQIITSWVTWLTTWNSRTRAKNTFAATVENFFTNGSS